MTKNYFIIVLMQLLVLSSAFAGVRSTGGGNGVKKIDGRVTLLDLELARPDYSENSSNQKLIETSVTKIIGFDKFEFSQTAEFRGAIEMINRWKISSPIITNLLTSALEGMTYKLTFHGLLAQKSYFIPSDSQVNESDIFTVVIYDPKFGAWISGQLWNLMGQTSRQALLVHEGLRHIQMKYQLGLSHKDIQDLVAKIFWENPESSESLDDFHFDGRLSKLLKENHELKESSKRIVSNSCSQLQVLAKNVTSNLQSSNQVFQENQKLFSDFQSEICAVIRSNTILVKNSKMSEVSALYCSRQNNLFRYQSDLDVANLTANLENFNYSIQEIKKFGIEEESLNLIYQKSLMYSWWLNNKNSRVSPNQYLQMLKDIQENMCVDEYILEAKSLRRFSDLIYAPIAINSWLSAADFELVSSIYNNLAEFSSRISGLNYNLSVLARLSDSVFAVDNLLKNVIFDEFKDAINGKTKLSSSEWKKLNLAISKLQEIQTELFKNNVFIQPYF